MDRGAAANAKEGCKNLAERTVVNMGAKSLLVPIEAPSELFRVTNYNCDELPAPRLSFVNGVVVSAMLIVAPDRTDSSSGREASPNRRPVARSTFER